MDGIMLRRLATVALTAGAVALSGCGEGENEVEGPESLQRQIDDVQDQVDDAQEQGERILEDPVGEGAREAQDQLNQQLREGGE